MSDTASTSSSRSSTPSPRKAAVSSMTSATSATSPGPSSMAETPVMSLHDVTDAPPPGGFAVDTETRCCTECGGTCPCTTSVPGFGGTYACDGCGHLRAFTEGAYHCQSCAFVGCADCTPKAKSPPKPPPPTTPSTPDVTAAPSEQPVHRPASPRVLTAEEAGVRYCGECGDGMVWRKAILGYGSKNFMCDGCGHLRPIAAGVFHCSGCSGVACFDCALRDKPDLQPLAPLSALTAPPPPVPTAMPPPVPVVPAMTAAEAGLRYCPECSEVFEWKTSIAGFGTKKYSCDTCGAMGLLDRGVFHCSGCAVISCHACAPKKRARGPARPASPPKTLQRPAGPPPPSPSAGSRPTGAKGGDAGPRYCLTCRGLAAWRTSVPELGVTCYSCDGCGALNTVGDGMYYCKGCNGVCCSSCAPKRKTSSVQALSAAPTSQLPGRVVCVPRTAFAPKPTSATPAWEQPPKTASGRGALLSGPLPADQKSVGSTPSLLSAASKARTAKSGFSLKTTDDQQNCTVQ